MLTLSVNHNAYLPITPEPTKQRRTRTIYTLDVFKKEAEKIHGSNYNYEEITDSHINNGTQSQIPIICNQCGHRWTTSIKVHINSKSKCPICARSWRWTRDSFIARARDLHGDKYDYNYITSEHINGKNSYVPILCKRCNKVWSPTIASHINNKSCCPNCPNVNGWNPETFLIKASQIHRDKYNYSLISEDLVTDAYGYGPIICNKYNYSLISEDLVTDAYSYVPIICNKCNKCNNRWNITVNNHINHGFGCPHCNISKGKLACESILKALGIQYISQATITSLPTRKYDFSFIYKGSTFLLEFDGMQHFQYVEHFHLNIDKFIEKQHIDYIKTQRALYQGYKVIRISYLQFDNIKHHIITALNLNKELYLSDPEIYQYISSKLISPNKYLVLNILKQ